MLEGVNEKLSLLGVITPAQPDDNLWTKAPIESLVTDPPLFEKAISTPAIPTPREFVTTPERYNSV